MKYEGKELYHYGIKGMKQGLRRFQNPDGSLTEAGKRRYLNPINSSYRIPYKGKEYKHLPGIKRVNDKINKVNSIRKEVAGIAGEQREKTENNIKKQYEGIKNLDKKIIKGVYGINLTDKDLSAIDEKKKEAINKARKPSSDQLEKLYTNSIYTKEIDKIRNDNKALLKLDSLYVKAQSNVPELIKDTKTKVSSLINNTKTNLEKASKQISKTANKTVSQVKSSISKGKDLITNLFKKDKKKEKVDINAYRKSKIYKKK